MTGMGILQPVIALAVWTMVMWAWMYAARIPAMNKAKLSDEELSTLTQAKLDAALPPQVQWKAYNYNHLHEAPTVFYAVAIVLAIVGQGDGLNAWLGWAYVALRVIHSLVQATLNRVMVRFALFVLSSLVLIALIVHAAMALF
jgi:hypothetical protein